jgi:hypothetical protein
MGSTLWPIKDGVQLETRKKTMQVLDEDPEVSAKNVMHTFPLWLSQKSILSAQFTGENEWMRLSKALADCPMVALLLGSQNVLHGSPLGLVSFLSLEVCK